MHLHLSARLIAVQTPDGQTALHLAARFGRLAVVECLLAYGCEPNMKDVVSVVLEKLNLVVRLPCSE